MSSSSASSQSAGSAHDMITMAVNADKCLGQRPSLADLKRVLGLYFQALEYSFSVMKSSADTNVQDQLKQSISLHMMRAEQLKLQIKAVEDKSVSKSDAHNYSAVGTKSSAQNYSAAVSNLLVLPP